MTARGRGIAGVGGDAGADRGRSEVDLGEQPFGLGEARVVLGEGRGEAVELLAERHRHSILQLGAADLEHVTELFTLAGEGVAQ